MKWERGMGKNGKPYFYQMPVLALSNPVLVGSVGT
jgi:hypothetical protein